MAQYDTCNRQNPEWSKSAVTVSDQRTNVSIKQTTKNKYKEQFNDDIYKVQEDLSQNVLLPCCINCNAIQFVDAFKYI